MSSLCLFRSGTHRALNTSSRQVTVSPVMYRRRQRLVQILLILTGVIILLVNFKHPIEPDIPDQPDILPYRIKLREIQGELVWPTRNVSVGLPISHIRDLGKNKSRVLLVIIVSTAPLRRERRDAIRQTWWKHCNTEEVRDVSFVQDLRPSYTSNFSCNLSRNDDDWKTLQVTEGVSHFRNISS